MSTDNSKPAAAAKTPQPPTKGRCGPVQTVSNNTSALTLGDLARARAKGPCASFVAIASLVLSGCATCQQHPVWCAVGTAVVVGSIAASIEHHHDQQHERQIAPGGSPQCRGGVCPHG